MARDGVSHYGHSFTGWRARAFAPTGFPSSLWLAIVSSGWAGSRSLLCVEVPRCRLFGSRRVRRWPDGGGWCSVVLSARTEVLNCEGCAALCLGLPVGMGSCPSLASCVLPLGVHACAFSLCFILSQWGPLCSFPESVASCFPSR
jgi:hypothetical protein